MISLDINVNKVHKKKKEEKLFKHGTNSFIINDDIFMKYC